MREDFKNVEMEDVQKLKVLCTGCLCGVQVILVVVGWSRISRTGLHSNAQPCVDDE